MSITLNIVTATGDIFTSKTKRSCLLLYWQKNIIGKNFNKKRIQKREI